jgi:hypothetical protein
MDGGGYFQRSGGGGGGWANVWWVGEWVCFHSLSVVTRQRPHWVRALRWWEIVQ